MYICTQPELAENVRLVHVCRISRLVFMKATQSDEQNAYAYSVFTHQSLQMFMHLDPDVMSKHVVSLKNKQKFYFVHGK